MRWGLTLTVSSHSLLVEMVGIVPDTATSTQNLPTFLPNTTSFKITHQPLQAIPTTIPSKISGALHESISCAPLPERCFAHRKHQRCHRSFIHQSIHQRLRINQTIIHLRCVLAIPHENLTIDINVAKEFAVRVMDQTVLVPYNGFLSVGTLFTNFITCLVQTSSAGGSRDVASAEGKTVNQVLVFAEGAAVEAGGFTIC